ncbi:MAG: hypothetical protein ACR2MK_10255 [Solirubrobacteraceae bacterium]
MRRLPVAAFVALAVATVAAFFVTQHLKVTTPLLAGVPAPAPAAINPIDGKACRVRTRTGAFKLVSHRSMLVSFYLQHRSDDIDVYIVGSDGTTIVNTLASGVHMRAKPQPVRKAFTWNGDTQSGSVAPDGTYYIRVSLIHQGRSFLISNNAGPEPVTVETVPPRPKVTAVTPHLIPQPGVAAATIRFTGTRHLSGRILIYRTDLPGAPQLVKSFASRRGSTSTWDGTLTGGLPAPQGTYLVGLEVTDRACNTGRFPPELPPVAGTTANAGVTVRYLAAQPPLIPVPAGSAATVYVDARRHAYRWTLTRPGTRRTLASGATSAYQLQVPLPAAGGAGLYELALRWGTHRTAVPLVASARAGGGAARVLVVLPALTWQGANLVDDDGDGLPNTLLAGDRIELGRPLADGLPAGLGDQAALVAYLHSAHLSYDLTTDLALAQGTGPSLASRPGVVLAGDERWLPPRLAAALRSYASAGGHVLSLGIDSLRRGVTLAGGAAYDPTAPRPIDALGARAGPLARTHGALILAGSDGLRIFSGTSGALRGYRAYQPFAPVAAGRVVSSAAGVASTQPAIIGYRLGRGIVIDVGLPGFGSSLAHNFDAQQLLDRIWSVLEG